MISLYQAFLEIKNEREFNAFLKDLLTPMEIRGLNARWKIAQMLWNTANERNFWQGAPRKTTKNSRIGMSQEDISRQFNTGSNTVSRVSKCLFENSDDGYRTLLGRLAPAALQSGISFDKNAKSKKDSNLSNSKSAKSARHHARRA